jgi:glucokinase
MAFTIGVDIGGTKVAGGVVDERGRVIDRTRQSTPARDSNATQAAIVAVVRELAGRHEVDAVGLAAAGLVDEHRATMLFSANLPGGAVSHCATTSPPRSACR